MSQEVPDGKVCRALQDRMVVKKVEGSKWSNVGIMQKGKEVKGKVSSNGEYLWNRKEKEQC